ncbi:Bcr/CflA family efflux MFS transporter [Hydrogenophaga sp. RAC07]|uniref:Bcr/CflA family efflux MFS transporter n=1 Tax=Hydrogenophaga sp. RAC07 TaxID=1842537 RepID=UPI00083D64C6|nr:Bcr/CflA family efflux MFS transporter [Hydrogenophaga sp. RAC07]
MPATLTSSPTSPAMSPGLVVLTLSLLLGLQPIATDLYLPALPALTEGFGAAMSQAQLTLTALLLAFGVSQMFWGPLSDRFGRRPILLIGMSAFVVASVGSTFSPSIEQLIVWRAVQGAAMGAGVMCARAVVRDLYAPTEGARMMSKGLTGLGVIACASAPLGGFLSDLLGWRLSLMAVAVFGAITLAVIAWRFKETLAAKNPRALQPGMLLGTWVQIARHPTFWAFALLSAASYCGLFTFLAASPFVFIQVLGLSKTAYGLTMMTMSLSYIVGTFICRRLLLAFGVRRTVALAAVLTLAGGTSMGVLALLEVRSAWAIMLPFYLFMMGHGVHQPCGQSGAVGPFPQAAGAASALAGFIMMIAAFVVGGWLGQSLAAIQAGTGTVLPLTNGIWFWSVLIALAAWTLVQRFGESRPGPERLAPADVTQG